MTFFIPERIGLLLDMENMTQKKLAEKAEIPERTLRQIRESAREFDNDTAIALSRTSGYPLTFFSQSAPSIPAFRLTNRKSSRTRVSEMKGVTAEYNMLSQSLELTVQTLGLSQRTDWLENIAPVVNPTLSEISDIALSVREELHVPSRGPVPNVIWALESGGIVVAPLKGSFDGRTYESGSEGVSAPEDQGTYGLIGYHSGARPGDRVRFTIAHELGHLVLHRKRKLDNTRQMEKEANLFAGMFLMPKRDAESLIFPKTGLHDLAMLKAKWGISIAALTSIGFNVDAIDSDRRRQLMMQISARGWRKVEPVTVHEERPLLFKQMLGQAFGRIDGPSDVHIEVRRAEDKLGSPRDLINTWADGLTFEDGDTNTSAIEREFNRIIADY